MTGVKAFLEVAGSVPLVPMRRRTLLAGAGIGLSMAIPGCSNVLRTDDSETTSTPTAPRPEIEDPDGVSRPAEPERRRTERSAVLIARWVEFQPEESEVEPYPTAEPPISEHPVLLDVFDRAAVQDEWTAPGTRTRTAEPRLGETVTETTSREKGVEVSNDVQKLDNWSDVTPTGRYFDHDGTLIVFHMEYDD